MAAGVEGAEKVFVLATWGLPGCWIAAGCSDGVLTGTKPRGCGGGGMLLTAGPGIMTFGCGIAAPGYTCCCPACLIQRSQDLHSTPAWLIPPSSPNKQETQKNDHTNNHNISHLLATLNTQNLSVENHAHKYNIHKTHSC